MFDFWQGTETLPLYGFIIRALIVYLYIFLIVKVLGQRSMSSIDALDFIFAVVIGDVLGEPLVDGELPMAGPVVAAAIISGLHLMLSIIALRTPRFRRIIEDEPIIIMRHGQILKEQLRKAKITVDELLMGLRQAGATDLNEVDYAILEMNGAISVIKKSQYDALTPNDMGQHPEDKGYQSVLIEDGRIVHANVKKVGNLNWLREKLAEYGVTQQDVFLMTIDETQSIYLSRK
ncbi:DUF421 domain-containing protein [Halalkalibacterium halodurans]|uniref:DUF421 domain-containing protein n=1 Tax=Halalkalibacterium halodurans TaxID=86665 RepID=A0A0M0KJA4_ALKHA|nr:DUF421 domain-containing protein [Halalkalibacterium halodurans]MED3648560.1 DUF421 domain-containing protein [Halalkalibacterium halodurans]TPE70171.1 DUF421 domain-containing protein [Halalkalibacterium halodurans]